MKPFQESPDIDSSATSSKQTQDRGDRDFIGLMKEDIVTGNHL